MFFDNLYAFHYSRAETPAAKHIARRIHRIDVNVGFEYKYCNDRPRVRSDVFTNGSSRAYKLSLFPGVRFVRKVRRLHGRRVFSIFRLHVPARDPVDRRTQSPGKRLPCPRATRSVLRSNGRNETTKSRHGIVRRFTTRRTQTLKLVVCDS